MKGNNYIYTTPWNNSSTLKSFISFIWIASFGIKNIVLRFSVVSFIYAEGFHLHTDTRNHAHTWIHIHAHSASPYFTCAFAQHTLLINKENISAVSSHVFIGISFHFFPLIWFIPLTSRCSFSQQSCWKCMRKSSSLKMIRLKLWDTCYWRSFAEYTGWDAASDDQLTIFLRDKVRCVFIYMFQFSIIGSGVNSEGCRISNAIKRKTTPFALELISFHDNKDFKDWISVQILA